MLKLKRKPATLQSPYATHTDFCRIFLEEMKSLHLLAFLLTANRAKAEECFLAALADVDKNSLVFREAASSWSRRAIIVNAIRMGTPRLDQAREKRDLWDGTETGSIARAIINEVTRLNPLERFAFVLSVLERYQDVECAMLFGCRRGEVLEARTRALQKLATAAPAGRRETWTLRWARTAVPTVSECCPGLAARDAA